MRLLKFLFIFCLSTLVASGQAPAHQNNASYLGYTYVNTPSYVTANIPAVANKLQFDYATNIIILNVGGLNSSGQINGGAANYTSLVLFLNTIASWEASNPGYKFQVFAWMSGDLASTDSNFIDVTNATVTANIAAESAKFTSTTSSGSYVAGANRTFDGVLIDFEPAGGTSTAETTQFNDLKSMMDGITTAIGPGKLTAFASPQYSATSSNRYFWSPTFYYYMALHVNYLVTLTYDTGLTTGAAYQSYMESQAQGVLQAVAGEYWSGGTHPPPANGVKVLFGFPAYPNNPPNHYADAETTQYAGLGVEAGLTTLDNTALANFGAAAVYLTTNGNTTDGYASWTGDWTNFYNYWLYPPGTTAQTISFAQPATPVTYGAASVSMGATSSSSLAISYSVTGPATITSSGVLTFTGAGAVVVTASQAGNTTYAAATPVSRTIVVNQATLTLNVAAGTYQRYFGQENSQASPAIAYTLIGFVSPDTQTSSTSGAPAFLGADPQSPVGSYTINAAVGTLTSTNYAFNPGNATATLNVVTDTGSGAAQAILFAPLANFTHTVSVPLIAIASSGLPVTFTVTSGNLFASISGTTLTVSAPGLVTVTASQPGNSSFGPATSVSQSFTAQ